MWGFPEGHGPQQWGPGNGNQWEGPRALRKAMGPEGRLCSPERRPWSLGSCRRRAGRLHALCWNPVHPWGGSSHHKTPLGTKSSPGWKGSVPPYCMARTPTLLHTPPLKQQGRDQQLFAQLCCRQPFPQLPPQLPQGRALGPAVQAKRIPEGWGSSSHRGMQGCQGRSQGTGERQTHSNTGTETGMERPLSLQIFKINQLK